MHPGDSFSGHSTREKNSEQVSYTSIFSVLEHNKLSASPVTSAFETAFNLWIKEESEIDINYEIENVPLAKECLGQKHKLLQQLKHKVTENNTMDNSIHIPYFHNNKNRQLVVLLKNLKIIEKDGNFIVDNLQRLSNSALNRNFRYKMKPSTQTKTLVNIDSMGNDLERFHEITYKDWKGRKNEELDIKESEASTSQDSVYKKVKCGSYMSEKSDQLDDTISLKRKLSESDYIVGKTSLKKHQLQHQYLEGNKADLRSQKEVRGFKYKSHLLLYKELEEHKQVSNPATSELENAFNLLKKGKPEMVDYKIENVPIEVPNNTSGQLLNDCKVTEEDLMDNLVRTPYPHNNQNLVVLLEKLKLIEKDGNLIVDNIDWLMNSALNKNNNEKVSTQNKTLEIDSTKNDSESSHEISYTEWKGKNEELYIKEDWEESEASISQVCVCQDNQVECDRCTPKKSDQLDDTISFPGTTNQPKAKRPSKKHACYFCEKLFSNLRKHWRIRHAGEPLVMEALENAKKQNIRNHGAFDTIRKLGDEKYNKENPHDLIVVREFDDKQKFVTCPYCRGYYSEKNYRNHKCKKSKNIKIGKARVESVNFPETIDEKLKNKIFSYFRKEDQRNAIFHDPVIMFWGNSLMKQYYKGEEKGDEYKKISSDLRLLADLFNLAKKNDSSIEKLDDLFYANKIQVIIDCISERAGFDGCGFTSPTVATGSFTIIKKVLSLLKVVALEDNKQLLAQRYGDCYSIVETHLTRRIITKTAAADRVAPPMTKKEIIPTTAQVHQLINIIEKETQEAYQSFQKNPTIQSYATLTKALLAKIMAFNRKRPGDVHRMLINEVIAASSISDEDLQDLSEEEKRIFSGLARVKTRQKLNVTSAIVTKKDNAMIKELITFRNEMDIHKENNPYVFATLKSKRSPFFRADDALKEICVKHSFDYQYAKAVRLRKHLAITTSGLPKDDQVVLSDFMGHNLDVQKAKQTKTYIKIIGRILFNANGFRLDGNSVTMDVTENLTNNHVPKVVWLCGSDLRDDDDNDDDDSNQETSNNTNTENVPRKVCLSAVTGEEEEEGTTHRSKEELPHITELLRKARPFIKKQIVTGKPKQTWSSPHKESIRQIFKKYIEKQRPPNLRKVQEKITLHKLHYINKTDSQILAWIVAEIKRNKEEKDGVKRHRWTTPQKKKLREVFASYYEQSLASKRAVYPSTAEILNAKATVPEFENKSKESIKSKLQHEYSLKITNIDASYLTDTYMSTDGSEDL